jgi:hypothetical protein
MAEFPEQKVHLGLGPRWVLVRWVARGLRKIEEGKYWDVGGGSCWTGDVGQYVLSSLSITEVVEVHTVTSMYRLG